MPAGYPIICHTVLPEPDRANSSDGGLMSDLDGMKNDANK